MEKNKLGSSYLSQMEKNAGDQIAKAFDEYKALMLEKIHPDNQTPAYHKKVQGTINRVMSAAYTMDEAVPGQGIFALFALALSTNVKLKDKLIEIEVDNKNLRKSINILKKQNGKK